MLQAGACSERKMKCEMATATGSVRVHAAMLRRLNRRLPCARTADNLCRILRVQPCPSQSLLRELWVASAVLVIRAVGTTWQVG